VNEIFRDPTEGALERRRDLLRRRREEWATMPHAVRRVVVARSARIAASSALALVGTLLIAAAWSPAVAHAVVRILPGGDPAPIATLLALAWVAGLAAYGLGRARAEHRFAVAMSRAVLPGEDLDFDIERLSHERPDELARREAHGLEVRSAAWPAIAAAAIGPATLVYVARALRAHGWPHINPFEDALVAHGAGLAGGVLAGLLVAAMLTRPGARRRGLAPLALVAALVAAAGALLGPAALATACVVTTALGLTVAYVVWRLGRERALIAATSPAAGSELFTVRGLARAVTSGLRAAAAFARQRRWVGAAAVGAGVLAIGFGVAFGLASRPAASQPRASAARVILPSPVYADPVAVPPRPQAAPDGVGQAHFAAHLDRYDGFTWTTQGLGGLAQVPAGWHARVVVTLTDPVPGDVHVTPFAGDPDVVPADFEGRPEVHVFEVNACHGPVPLGLRVVSPDGPRDASFTVSADLSLAGCPDRR
jgi:hypothetical protein